MTLIILSLSSLIITNVFLPFTRWMLVEGRSEKENYQGNLIPVGMGLTLIPVLIVHIFIVVFFYPSGINTFLLFLGGNLAMAFVGMLDDLIGSREATGFKGHMGSLLRGKLTTGGFKALIGGMMALLISLLLSSNWIQLIVNILVVALMTNLLNLLDLRPGRGIKSFLILTLVFFAIGLTFESQLILAIVVGYCFAYFPQDLKAKAMMGDVGSNTLGITLGIAAVLSFSFFNRLLFLGGLILLHGISEKYSISKIIKENRLLDFIDQLGR